MQEDSKKYTTGITISLIFSLALIVTAFILTGGLVKFREGQKTIEVVGSAKKQIKSDLVVWTGSFSAQSKKISEAYPVMKQGAEKVRRYLAAKGLTEKDMIFTAISTTPNYVLLKNGQQSNEIESYRLSQSVEIRSGDVDKITDISRKATELINEGVEFQSHAPQYYYTKIADLKIEVLSLASKDAKVRADRIAENTGSRTGRLIYANMGVFQITPLYSTEVSDLGVYDTASIDKEITAVVICKFEIGR
jgi:uncharacterized protein